MKEISEIQILYEQGILNGLPIELKHSSELDFSAECDTPVILAHSELGTMMLYKEDENYSEFVFDITYEKTTFLTKKKITVTEHWHPQTLQDAQCDMFAFLKNDKDYFKKTGIKFK